MTPSLTVLCTTNHSAAVVAASLAKLGDVADEIVVATDERTGADDLRGYAAVADAVFTYPFTGPNRFRPWSGSLVRSEWLLLLDGDEIVGAELIHALPQLIADRRCAGYTFPCRWVFPDGGTYLAGEPWTSDRHLRLVRNDDRLWFPGVKHRGVATLGPERRADIPFYHLALVLDTAQARRERVSTYNRQAFGLVTVTGHELNAAFYLPEDASDVMLAPVPTADRELIEAALTGKAHSHWRLRKRRRRHVSITHASVDDVERWHPDELTKDWELRLQVLECPNEAPASSLTSVLVRVSNGDRSPFPPSPHQLSGLRLSYRWSSPSGNPPVTDGLRTPIPHVLEPGEHTDIVLNVATPVEPGEYVLVLDIVHEFHRWFGLDVKTAVEVGPAARAQLASDVGPSGLVGLERCLELRRSLRWANSLLPYDMIRATPRTGDNVLDGILALADVGPWSIDPACLAYVAEVIREQRPAGILELGSGISTLAIAALLRDLGATTVSLQSVDHSAHFAEKTRQLLPQHELAALVDLHVVPLARYEVGGILVTGYAEGILGDIAAATAPELVLIDGPPFEDGAVRYSVLPVLLPHLNQGARILLHDALRDAELMAVSSWSQLARVEVRGILPCGNGLAELVVTG